MAPEPDAVLASLLEGQSPEASARVLAQLINRAAARLHTLSRAEAAARKDQPAWPQWAQLQNAARALVLQASTARELAARLPTPAPAAADASANAPAPPPPAAPQQSANLPPPPAAPDESANATAPPPPAAPDESTNPPSPSPPATPEERA